MLWNHVCASLHPHAPRLMFFFLKKGKLLSQRNREGFTELCNRKTRAHARTQHTQRTHTRTHARTHTSHGEAGKGGRVSLRSAPFASGRAVGTRVVCKGVTGRGGRRPVQCVCVWCECVYLLTNFSPRLSCTVSRLFITLHKNKLQVHWVKSQKKEKCHDGQPLTVDVRACVCFVKEHARACTYRRLLHPSLEFRV